MATWGEPPAVIKSAALKEEVTLQVLRGAQLLQVWFDPRLQDNSDQLGGGLWPSSR